MDDNFELSKDEMRELGFKELDKLIEQTEDSQQTYLHNKLQLIKKLLK